MAKSNPKPWERGYIPPAKVASCGWTVPPAPPGWEAYGQEAKRWEAKFVEAGSTTLLGRGLVLTAARGQPWRLAHVGYKEKVKRAVHDVLYLEYVQTETLLFAADDLEAVLVWLKIEREAGEDSRLEAPGAYFGTRTGRSFGKHAALAAAYGAGAKLFTGGIGTLNGEVVHKAFAKDNLPKDTQLDVYADLARYCTNDVFGDAVFRKTKR